MRLVEPVIVLVISLFAVLLAAGLFVSGAGDFYKTILLFIFGIYGVFVALTIPTRLEIAGSELIIRYLVSKVVVAREDIQSYFLGEQGVNRRTRKFVTIHFVNGRRISFKSIREGNESLLQALEKFTGVKPAVDQLSEPTEEEEMADASSAPEPLSELTERLVQKLFQPEDQYEARQLLIHQCGNNVYGHTQDDKYELEPLRFSALKASRGDLKKLKRAIQTANEDYRNIYAESGFLGEKSREKQQKWVESILGE